jgi:hypothetical protein
LDESLLVFENIVNLERFEDIPIVLCFTCVDLLRITLRYSPQTALEYFGTFDFIEICEIQKKMFLKRIKKKETKVFFLDLLDVNATQEMMFTLFGVDKKSNLSDSRFHTNRKEVQLIHISPFEMNSKNDIFSDAVIICKN